VGEVARSAGEGSRSAVLPVTSHQSPVTFSPALQLGRQSHASPSVRKFARELGADLARIKGTAPKNRITHEDVKAWVKRALT